jgi:hypothetical protein
MPSPAHIVTISSVEPTSTRRNIFTLDEKYVYRGDNYTNKTPLQTTAILSRVDLLSFEYEIKRNESFSFPESYSVPLLANQVFEGADPLLGEELKAFKEVLKQTASKESLFPWVK